MRLVNREKELDELNRLLQQARSQAQFLMVYGRRRIGKTSLLLHWVRQARAAGWQYIYWAIREKPADALRADLAEVLWKWKGRTSEPPPFPSWRSLFDAMGDMIGDEPTILILDEFPYAVTNDPSLPSELQHTWDHLFQRKPFMLVVTGSHISMMVEMLNYNAPLYGRFSAQLPVKPLSFGALREFFPEWSAVERVSAYAVLGGVPAYLQRFDPSLSLSENIRQHLFRPTGMFQSEPKFLIADLVRTTTNYEAVLRAVARGAHTFAEIAKEAGFSSSQQAAPYLKQLTDLQLIERRVPATVPREQRHASRRGHYHLHDPYLRFYYRFIEPYPEMIEMEMAEALWQRIKEEFRAFVGATTFEELCRQWVVAQARAGKMPFVPEYVGSHWSTTEQIDVVAINWREKAILFGECKWGDDVVRRPVVRKLMAQSANVVPSPEWRVYYAFFGRSTFTAAAQAEADSNIEAFFVDLVQLDADLSAVMA